MARLSLGSRSIRPATFLWPGQPPPTTSLLPPAKFNPPELIDCTCIEGSGHDETCNQAVDEAGVDAEVHYAGPQND